MQLAEACGKREDNEVCMPTGCVLASGLMRDACSHRGIVPLVSDDANGARAARIRVAVLMAVFLSGLYGCGVDLLVNQIVRSSIPTDWF